MRGVGDGWEAELDPVRDGIYVAVRDANGEEYEYAGDSRYREAMWRAFFRLVASGKLRDPAEVARRALLAVAHIEQCERAIKEEAEEADERAR